MNDALKYIHHIATPKGIAELAGIPQEQLLTHIVDTAFGKNSSDTRLAIMTLFSMVLNSERAHWGKIIQDLQEQLEEYEDADTLRALEEDL